MTQAPGPISPITDAEFDKFRDFIYERAGIAMTPQKRQLVAGRLMRRVTLGGHASYGAYFDHVIGSSDHAEQQCMIDCLTTNETYFFREPAHFDFMTKEILPGFRGRPFRAWSAACSTGEEVYTLAMLLAEGLGSGDWQVLGTDINQQVLQTARTGLYPMDRASGIPPALLSKYCLKGVRSQAGYLLIEPKLKQRVRFEPRNLKAPLPPGDGYDVIFLRNVLIYFDGPTKLEVVRRVASRLRPGGHFFVSHVESLHGLPHGLQQVRSSVFRRPPEGRP